MDIEILDWTSDLDRPSAIDALDTADLPVCHTVSVTERRISIDDRTLIQNNVRTDTLALDLDGEWDGANVVVLIGKTGSEVELEWKGEPVVIPAQVAESVGAIDVSVVGYSSDGTVRLVTAEAAGAMTVIRSGALTGEVPADEAPDVLAQLLESATQARDAASTATSAAQTASDSAASADAAAKAAQDATSAATTATAKATEAASAANEAANTANAVIAKLPLPDGNVPRATRRGEVVSVDDAFAAVPLGLKVYGRTRQNLWVNPSGTMNGVTVTRNEDGSFSIDGTATDRVNLNSEKFYTLKPNTEYTLSIDKAIQDYRIGVNQRRADGSQAAFSNIKGSNSLTFTTQSDMAYCYASISAEAGSTVSGTYRVMLNEGSTAEPWCPPGLTSAEPTQVVVAGKNLLGEITTGIFQDVTFTGGTEGEFTISGTPHIGGSVVNTKVGYVRLVPGVEYCLSIDRKLADTYSTTDGGSVFLRITGKTTYGKDINVGYGSTLSKTFTVDDSYDLDRVYIQAAFRTNVYEGTYKLMLNIGSTADDWEPPNVTTLNLDPVELRGLPDGTADVLDVGSGSVEGKTEEVTIDGSTVAVYGKTGDYQFNVEVDDALYGTSQSAINVFSDALPNTSASSVYGGNVGVGFNQNGKVVMCLPGNPADVDEANAWLKSNNVNVVYPRTKTTSTIPPVALPKLPSPVCNVWAVSDVPCEVEMEYVRDVNVVLSKLEGAM